MMGWLVEWTEVLMMLTRGFRGEGEGLGKE